MAHFTNLITKQAKTPKETRSLLVEFEDRARMFQEIVGVAPEDRHAMRVLVGIIDTETLKHTAAYQGSGLAIMKQKVREFVNMVGGSPGKGDPMDISGFQEKDEEKEAEGGGGEGEDWEGWGAWEGVNALGEKRFSNQFGHCARECPYPAKGKGGYKGKGKGGTWKGGGAGKGGFKGGKDGGGGKGGSKGGGKNGSKGGGKGGYGKG